MRVAMYQGEGRGLKLETVADPAPGEGQVVVRVGRCGICSSDLHMTEGHDHAIHAGGVLGHEFGGTIVALGKGVAGVAVGDRVAVVPAMSCMACGPCLAGAPFACERGSRTLGVGETWGGYAEYAVAMAPWCVPLPSGLTDDDAALAEPMAVGLHGVRMAGITPGDTVLVIGAGAVGLAVAYWARRAGAGRVIVTASSARREGLAAQMGATDFLVPAEGETLSGALSGLLGGRKADIVFECAGVSGMIDTSVACVKRGGLIVVLGICMAPDPISTFPAVLNEVTIKFSFVADRREYEIVLDALSGGSVEPRATITGTVSLDQTPAKFESLRTDKSATKVMIAPWG